MSSPRKVVPLASGPSEGPRPQTGTSRSSVVRRAFFCSVVFEGGQHGNPLPQDVQNIIMSLGTQLSSEGKPVELDQEQPTAATSTEALLDPGSIDPPRRNRALTDASTFADILNELVTTERSYVRRINTLKQSYADPLRSFARTKDTAIIPAYEAKTLFGNIDALIPANEAFLVDLEKMIGPNGHRLVGGIGDIALKHFKELKTFDCYRLYYSKREEAQAIFEREMLRKSSTGFAGFIDRIKYSTSDTKNRVGLRELLMDPVQRIPRYTLLFRTMIKHMPESDPQRIKLIEAEDAASKIAQCETDEQTKRAAVMYCLERTVDGFPPGLISNSRKFIDCIDVDDMLLDPNPSIASGSTSTTPSPLACTLFLFDDRLMIVKRHSSSASGRVVAGLDEIEKLAKTGIIGGTQIKKGVLSCKGVVDITDVVATDPGGSDLHIFLEQEPPDQSDRWSNRPFRSLSVVHPPLTASQSSTSVAEDKTRFLENLWLAQAMYRSRSGRSVPFVSQERDVGNSSRRVTLARTYFNVYQRTAYLSEPKKSKVVLHIDPFGTADSLPFGMDCGPFVIVRAQPMAGELCRYTVTCSDESDEGEEDIVHSSTVASRIVQTIHQCGLFKFRTSITSQPSTPTASTRGRAAIFNLDAISRNLFNTKSSTSSRGISGADFFSNGNGSSTPSSHKRSRSNASRASVIQMQSTGTTVDSSFKFSQRSSSTSATSVVDESSFGPRSREASTQKLVKRGRSPDENVIPPKSRYNSRERSGLERDMDPWANTTRSTEFDESEWDLSMRLELARQNSLSQQHTGDMTTRRTELSLQESILEEDTSSLRRAPSTASTFRPRPTTPTPMAESPSRPSSAMSIRRPMGPREAPKSPNFRATNPEIEEDLEATLVQLGHPAPLPPPPRTPSPPVRSPRKRVPAYDVLNVFSTPPATATAPEGLPGTVEPLSIKKKNSIRQTSPTWLRKPRDSPLSRNPVRNPTISKRDREPRKIPSNGGSVKSNLMDRTLTIAETTLEDVNSSCRAIKRIKLEVESVRTLPYELNGRDWANQTRGSAPSPSPQSPQGRYANRAAEARMEEMRQLIERGRGGPTSRIESPVRDVNRSESLGLDGLKELVDEADRDMKQALANCETLQFELKNLVRECNEQNVELDKAQNELRHAKRQCELVKKLLADATAENEIMYDAFNEELDGMFQDTNLPDSEAWRAMTDDLCKTKDERSMLSKENSSLKRNLELAQLQNEEWGALLRSHGLIS